MSNDRIASHHNTHRACPAASPEERDLAAADANPLRQAQRVLLGRQRPGIIGTADNITGLVDLDRALWGDVEIEFAVLDYCGISKPTFWEGYRQPRDESLSAEIRRLFYLLYEVQKYMPIHIWRRSDPTGAARYKQHNSALAAQLGLG